VSENSAEIRNSLKKQAKTFSDQKKYIQTTTPLSIFVFANQGQLFSFSHQHFFSETFLFVFVLNSFLYFNFLRMG
jgi:hypothetical protein